MKKKTSWDLAIEDFKDNIRTLERKIKRLRESIEVFEQERDGGKPWPGEKKAGTATESIPA